MFILRSINKVSSQTTFASPLTYIQNYMAIYDFDIAMVNFSIRPAHNFMLDKLIHNISVSMTKTIYAKITNERYYLVTPELLARKWGMGL